MRGKIFRDMLIIGTLALGVAYAAAHKETVYETLGLVLPETPDKHDTSRAATTQMTHLTGSVVSIPKSTTDGQFWTHARVNGGTVHFLVDTGASAVALTVDDAKRAGIKTDRLKYNVPIATAGGENRAAYVTIEQISVGAVTIRDVRALVVPEGLSTSLLGMTFLGELQKVEATPNALILRL